MSCGFLVKTPIARAQMRCFRACQQKFTRRIRPVALAQSNLRAQSAYYPNLLQSSAGWRIVGEIWSARYHAQPSQSKGNRGLTIAVAADWAHVFFNVSGQTSNRHVTVAGVLRSSSPFARPTASLKHPEASNHRLRATQFETTRARHPSATACARRQGRKCHRRDRRNSRATRSSR